MKGILKLSCGKIFKGTSFGANRNIKNEICFTTGLVGYPQSMSDPSFLGQILVFTQPIIGSYGIPSNIKDKYGLFKNFESDGIKVAGIIVGNYSEKYSHWSAVRSLSDWCNEFNIPAITDIDTRALTMILREQHTIGTIYIGDNKNEPNEQIQNFNSDVSIKIPQIFNPDGIVKIAMIDFGVKQSIIRCLIKRNCQITVYPYNTDISLLIDKYDGFCLSNGPGDPKMNNIAINNIRKLIEKNKTFKPIFGICMGLQILGLAIGMDTYKMKFGNRGHNQPVLDLINGGCKISSQNHGYALNENTLPNNWIISFKNANDNSIEGIKHLYLHYSSVQFHPESNSGPNDFEYLFDDFVNNCK